MVQVAPGWQWDVNRESDWLLVKLKPADQDPATTAMLAEALWELLRQHVTYRLVLELDQLAVLYTALIGQLVLLHKRLSVNGGVLRLCGLSPHNQDVLHLCRLDDRFPPYGTREDAVLGRQPPCQPR
jgi:anti-anti-sigma factor